MLTFISVKIIEDAGKFAVWARGAWAHYGDPGCDDQGYALAGTFLHREDAVNFVWLYLHEG